MAEIETTYQEFVQKHAPSAASLVFEEALRLKELSSLPYGLKLLEFSCPLAIVGVGIVHERFPEGGTLNLSKISLMSDPSGEEEKWKGSLSVGKSMKLLSHFGLIEFTYNNGELHASNKTLKGFGGNGRIAVALSAPQEPAGYQTLNFRTRHSFAPDEQTQKSLADLRLRVRSSQNEADVLKKLNLRRPFRG